MGPLQNALGNLKQRNVKHTCFGFPSAQLVLQQGVILNLVIVSCKEPIMSGGQHI